MPKFVKWVPTPPQSIDSIFELVPVSSSDIIYDLGSGDGRLLFAAVEKGAGKCIGIDIDPEMVNTSRKKVKNKSLNQQITFIEGDVTEQDLSEATVIFCYLLHSASSALKPKFEKELKSGTKVVMELFPIKGWKPTRTKVINGRLFYLYTMLPDKTEEYDSILKNTTFEYDWWYWP